MMPTIIFGAVGHPRVVLNTLCCAGVSVSAFADEQRRIETPDGVAAFDIEEPVWVDMVKFLFVVAIGDNEVLEKIIKRPIFRGEMVLRHF